jgi:ABC-type arginine/histidine transport system permease subunit
MLIDLRYSRGLRAPLIIFVLALLTVGLVSLIFAMFVANAGPWAFLASMYFTIFVGIPVGLGSILIFLGLRLKAQGDSILGYGPVMGLGAFIFAGLVAVYYILFTNPF